MPSPDETAQTLVGGPRAEAYCGACNRSFADDQTVCPYDGTKLVRFAARVDTLIDRVLDGRYRIESRLGEGGMGAVYRARQLSVDRLVAIKVVHPAIAADREIAKRFLREARLASSLNAPGIVAVFDFGQTEDGLLYLVMELIEGSSLERLAKQGRQSASRIVQIALQLCDALEVAHGAGIIHRDLKPANIIVLETPTGPVVKVLDFGIAKVADTPSITSTRAAVGTPMYMAPEQFDGRATTRSDLYSLGCVLFELASGAPPFTGNDLPTLVTRHLTQPPPPLPPEIPPDIAATILRLLAKRPDDRFASAAELREELAHADVSQIGSAPIIRTQITPVLRLPSTPAPAPNTPPAPQPVATEAPSIPAMPKRRGGRALIGLALVVVVAGGSLAYIVAHRQDRTDTGTATPTAASASVPPATSTTTTTPSPATAPAATTPSANPASAGSAAPVAASEPSVSTTPEPAASASAATKHPGATRPTTKHRPVAKKKAAGGSDDTELPFAPTD